MDLFILADMVETKLNDNFQNIFRENALSFGAILFEVRHDYGKPKGVFYFGFHLRKFEAEKLPTNETERYLSHLVEYIKLELKKESEKLITK